LPPASSRATRASAGAVVDHQRDDRLERLRARLRRSGALVRIAPRHEQKGGAGSADVGHVAKNRGRSSGTKALS
jgi:hypothetical protein